MTVEVIPLRPGLFPVDDDDRLSFTDRLLNRFDALAARSPVVVRRRSTLNKREMAAFNLGQECAKYMTR